MTRQCTLSVLLIISLMTACSGPQPSSPSPDQSAAPETGPGTTADPAGSGQSAPTAGKTQDQLAKELYEINPVEPGVDGDWLIHNLPVEPQTLNPFLDTADAYTARVTYARQDVFESLLERDRVTLEYGPKIAEKWEISPDHLIYTFNLRKNVKFSDGTPLTSKDVKFSFDAIRNPANETADLRNYLQDITSIETPDDYTVVFKCVRPYFLLLSTIGDLPILPQHVYGNGDFNTHPNNRLPVGSGPYVFDGWQTNLEIALKRNPEYWNHEKLPHILRYVYRIIVDDEAALQALLKRDLDAMPLTPEQWVNRTNEPAFTENFVKKKYYGFSGYVGSFQYVGWNMRKPQFSDKYVRRALTMLLDRDTILDKIYYGLGMVTSGTSPVTSQDYDVSIAPWPYDPEKANALLDEAGWTARNSDGVRMKDGALFEFTLMYPPGNSETDRWTTVYQESLKRAGIKMNIRPIEWATFLEYITKREFDAVTLQWAIPPESDPYQLWHSSQTEKGSNYPGFKNAEADKIIEDARLEFDRDKRAAMYHRFHAILHEEQPYTFFLSRPGLGAFDKRFHNLNVYPLGPDPTEWFVPAAMQRYK